MIQFGKKKCKKTKKLENAYNRISLYEFLKSFVFFGRKTGALSKADINSVNLLFVFSDSLVSKYSHK
jgi:hypothetical protein